MKNLNSEYVYIFWTPAYPLFFKLGISYSPRKRAMQVSKSIRRHSKVYVLCSNKMFFAFFWEQTFHAAFFFLNCRMFVNSKVSGRTEFFFLPILPFAVIWVLVPELINLAALLALIYYFL
jgi:ribosomal protein L36